MGLTCQYVVDAGHHGLLRKSHSFALSGPTLEFLHVWVAHPRSRIDASRWHVLGRCCRSLESTGVADVQCSSRSYSERHVAKTWQRYDATSLLRRSDYLHVRRKIRRLDCTMRYASSLLLPYSWPSSMTIFDNLAYCLHFSHRTIYTKT